MVVEEVTDVLADVVLQIGQIALWLQALGIVVLVWIIFQAINLFINKKRINQILEIRGDVKRIENKIDKILKKVS